jgi:hypothetical protein
VLSGKNFDKVAHLTLDRHPVLPLLSLESLFLSPPLLYRPPVRLPRNRLHHLLRHAPGPPEHAANDLDVRLLIINVNGPTRGVQRVHQTSAAHLSAVGERRQRSSPSPETLQGEHEAQLEGSPVYVLAFYRRFRYGATMGAVAGFIMALPGFFRQRQVLGLIINPIIMGLFFGTLVSVSTVLGKLETYDDKPRPDLRMKLRNEQGVLLYSTYPFWTYGNACSLQKLNNN